MLKYLIENKEWIFSGIGVFLLAAGISIIRFYLNRRKTKKENKENSTKEQITIEKVEGNNTTNALEISNITVKTIIDEIHNVPPFQRDAASENYNGIKVRWEGKLWNVEKVYSSNKLTQTVRVIFHPIRENLHYSVQFEVNIDQYPELKIAKRDSMIIAEGKIIRCSGEGMYVDIEPSKLHLFNSQ